MVVHLEMQLQGWEPGRVDASGHVRTCSARVAGTIAQPFVHNQCKVRIPAPRYLEFH